MFLYHQGLFNIFCRVFIGTSKSERLLDWKYIEEFSVSESVQFTFYKMCLKTHVDSTFLMNTRIPGSLLLELEISAILSLISCI